jgi:hypothetical protein
LLAALALVALALVALPPAASAAEEIDPDPARLIADLPAPELWEPAGPPSIYDGETLYEYIDGAARLYREHGFTRLAHLDWSHTGEGGAGIDLDVYHMGSVLGAYGIYGNTRPLDAEKRSWGAEGYLHGGVAAAWKGPVYVRAKVDSAMTNADPALAGMVTTILQRVPGEPEFPRLLRLLPEEHRVANSDRYVPRDLLGHAFLPGGFLADYEIDEEAYRLFLFEKRTEEEALAAWSNLQEQQRRSDGDPRKVKGLGDAAFRATDAALGPLLVARRGSLVAGVYGGPAEGPTPRRLLEQILAAVEKGGEDPQAPVKE